MKNRSEKSILIVAGGTGGHISPGAALAESILEKGRRPVFLSLNKNKSYPEFKKGVYSVHFYGAPPVTRSLSFMLFPFRFAAALLKAYFLMRKENVGSCVGMGGYSVLPALAAAKLSGIPVFLCEQNAHPGKATVFYSGTAEKIFLNFPDRSGKLNAVSHKCIAAGNPVRKFIADDAGSVKRSYEKKELTILVLGGSQGALQLNEMFLNAQKHFAAKWLVQCGRDHVEKMKQEDIVSECELFGFHSAIHELYRQADVLICRAGAGVLSEGCLYGLPMILVPYPFAADNHQRENALCLSEDGAAEVLDTRSTDPQRLLEILRDMSENPEMRRRMGEKAKKHSHPEAAGLIADRILERTQ